jgi:hypothetical protein
MDLTACLEAIHVQAGRQQAALVIASVPLRAVMSGAPGIIDKFPHRSPEKVEDDEAYRAVPVEAEAHRGLLSDTHGIGIILLQCEAQRRSVPGLIAEEEVPASLDLHAEY